MEDRVKELLKRVQEWWNKFTAKQKTIIVGVVAVSIFALVILIWVFSQPQYELLKACDTTAETSEVTALLDSAGIGYDVTEDGLQVSVQKRDISTARIALGAAGIPATSPSIDDVVNGGFSTTEADKQKRYLAYQQAELEEDLLSIEAIKMAKINLEIPEQNGTLISTGEEASASAFLEIEGEFTTDNAAYVARYIATALGNETTNNITILDTKGNMLFSGESEFSVTGIASSQISVRQQAENSVINSVKKVLFGTNQYNSIEVACNLDIDFSTKEQTNHNFSAPDGRTEGMLTQEDLYNAESDGSNGGIPGTDSNDEEIPTYDYSDLANSSSTESEESRKYAPNEEILSSSTPAGEINFQNSSASVTAISYNVIKEEDARSQGLLEGFSWDEYKAANSEQTKMEVDPDLYSVVATATGMNQENITILAYRENYFIDAEGLNINWSDVISVILILVILGVLGFVVLKSMQSKKEPVTAEELSVETLLQSQPDEEVEDIELESKSETRKMIEKFVNDNPEAAANLLRNWLNEDWG